MLKNLPVMQETQVRSLGQEGLLEKGMATHSSIHAWRIPWTEEIGGLESVGLQRVRHDFVTNSFTLSHQQAKEGKTHHILDAEKAFEKLKHPFMIKSLSKLGIEGHFLNLEHIYKKIIAHIILNGEKLEAFPLRSPLSPLHFCNPTGQNQGKDFPPHYCFSISY